MKHTLQLRRHKSRWLIGLVCAFFVLLAEFVPFSTVAQENENAVKAAFIYNLIPFVEWPGGKKKAVHMCVVGEGGPVADYLEAIIHSGTAKSTRKIDMVHKERDSRIDECSVLYLSEMSKGNIDYMIAKSQDMPILTVSDVRDFVARGGMIGLKLGGGQVKLEGNLGAIKRSKLVIDSELLELIHLQ